jgi:hypothetical protein
MAEAVLKEEARLAPKEVRITPVEEVRTFREELSRVIRTFWDSPTGRRLAGELSKMAIRTGFADDMKKIMRGVKGQIADAAARANLSGNYKRVWGKTE